MTTHQPPQPAPPLSPLPSSLSPRTFLRATLPAAARAACHKGDATPGTAAQPAAKKLSGDALFKISLAEWSLHRALRGGLMDHLDFPTVAKEDYGIDAVEYVNTFFK